MIQYIEDRAVILFQGDSITDAGRSYANPDDLGPGYAGMINAWVSAQYPEKNLCFVNRGISGNRVKDLRDRWQRDCLDLHPTWVSILIGINDTWRRYDSHDITPPEAFEKNYRVILKQVRDRLGARLIICEPFLLTVVEGQDRWREDLDPKIAIARELAIEFEAIYIPLDEIFARAATQREKATWLVDGVHPTIAGHALIAQTWLKSVGL
jgi:acyl-CoA thioesterase I